MSKDIPMGPAGIAVVWDRMQNAEYKLRQIHELLDARSMDPHLEAELRSVLDL